jgi:hypothetical protein
MPNEIQERPSTNWPTDFNSTGQDLLENWLASNSQAFEYFREAVNKTYYWIKGTTAETDDYLTKNYMGSLIYPVGVNQYLLTKALGWDAKIKATKGKFQIAFEDIIECYKAGSHNCRSNHLLMVQSRGLYIKQNAIQDAFIILDKSKVDNKYLKFLQDSLQQEFDRDTYIPGCQAEKLYQLDKLQRMFIDNGRGTGRLWWRMVRGFVIPSLSEEARIRERKMKMSCFTGPTKKQAVEQIEKTVALFNQVIIKTPWQIKNDKRNYFKEIDNTLNHYVSLKILDIGIYPFNISDTFYQTRAQTEALITVLAILRFITDKGQFPASLEELVSAGYLESVPMDPYSDEPLVYKPEKDNFKLYSVGKNFSDDGGSYESKATEEYRLQYGGPFGYSADIVYWPFIDLEKLHYEVNIKNTEAAVRREIEKANQPK